MERSSVIAPGTTHFSKAAKVVDIAARLKSLPICGAALKSSGGFNKVGCTRVWDQGVGDDWRTGDPSRRRLAEAGPRCLRVQMFHAFDVAGRGFRRPPEKIPTFLPWMTIKVGFVRGGRLASFVMERVHPP